MKQWWERTMINTEALKKISLALRRGRQLENQANKQIVDGSSRPATAGSPDHDSR